MKRILSLFFTILLLSCGVKQPVDHNTTQKFGDIIVTSIPAGALIYLDGHNTGKSTPDTLTLISLGTHIIHITLDEHQAIPDSIVVEVREHEKQHASFTLEKLHSIGTVYIESDPMGAEIFIDGQNSGTSTPGTLQLERGHYEINIVKNGYISYAWQVDVVKDSTTHLTASLTVQNRVLLEAFGNVSCTPCVDAAHNLHTFTDNTPPSDYAIIEYYANWPSPNDPFYKQAPEDVMERVMYYQLTTLPSMFVGGSIGVDATRYDDINQAFQNAFAAQATPIGLSIDKSLVDGILQVTVEINQFAPYEGMEELGLFVAIVENNIHFDTPPGSNGLTDFDVVFRGFLSDKKGDPFEDKQTLSYTLTWSDWDYAHSQVIAFIQNRKTKQIIHTSIN